MAGNGRNKMSSESRGSRDSAAGHLGWCVPADARFERAQAELFLNPATGAYRLQQPGTRPVAAMQMTDPIGLGRRAVGKRCVRLAVT